MSVDWCCAICGGREATGLVIQERMYGTREPFDYWECSRCGTVQIDAIPENLADYYPSDYYSFSRPMTLKRRVALKIAGAMGRRAPRALIQALDLTYVMDVLPPPPATILDIGSGDGTLIRQLRHFGYKCFGFDPYTPADVADDGVTLWGCAICDVPGSYDVVMSHHSLEHMSDPHEFFAEVGRLLKPGGIFVLRLPILPNCIWDTHGTDWPQLDAPRHLFTYTLDSLKILADAYGLKIISTDFDARPWSLAAAREYRAGRSLRELTADELRGTPEDASATRQANVSGTGDQVRLVMTKT